MKKVQKILSILFVFAIKAVVGQISGTVTVNSGSPTTGTNYQSFTALASQLNTSGVSASLIVNVVPNSGPYIEQPIFLQASGVSATNTILIKGNNNLLSFSSNNYAQPWTLSLNGADYMRFEFLNVIGLGTYATACNLSSGADHNSFSYCNFSVSISPTAMNQTAVDVTGGNYNSFRDCSMTGGSYAGVNISSFSAPYGTNNSLWNCSVTDWGAIGVESNDQQNLSVNYCSISRPNRLNPVVGTGIYFYTPLGGINCVGNCLSNFFGAAPTSTIGSQGIVFSNTIPGLAPSIISHNLINNMGSNSPLWGIAIFMLNGVCNSNTVIMNGSVGSNTSYNTDGIVVTTASASDSLHILGNYLALTPATGVKYAIIMSNSTNNILVNRNLFYIPSGNPNLYFGAGPGQGLTNNFTTWQNSGHDQQGTYYSVNPNFTLNPYCGIGLPSAPDCNFGLPPGLFCSGSTVTFSDISTNNPNSWYWSVSPLTGVSVNTSTLQNPQITFSSPGVYSVTAVASNTVGPGSSVTNTINIIAPPNIQVSASNDTICVGAPASLTASGATTYTWNNGTTGPIVNTTPTITTTYTVLGSNASGCVNSSTKTVVVNALPTLSISGGSVVCAGSGIYLTATGATSYLWGSGDSGSQLFVTPIITSNYSVVGNTNGYGCSNSAIITISVIPSPTLTVSSTTNMICAGSTVTLNVTGANTYLWISGSTNSLITVSPVVTSAYSVSGTSNSTGCSNSAVVTITVNPLPVLTLNATAHIVCAGKIVTLSVTGANNYTWSTGLTIPQITVSPVTISTYSVSGITNNGCSSSAALTVSVSTCTGIEPRSPEEMLLNLFPNPNDGNLTIEFSAESLTEILIYNSLGDYVFSALESGTLFSIDLSGQSNGIYFVKIKRQGVVIWRKIQKQ